MTPGRLALGGLGLLVGAYGVLRLLELGWANLVATVAWLAGAVVGHDAVLAPVVLLVCAVGVLVVPRWWRAAAAGAMVVLGTVTLTAVPVLGRFGARTDNATLLDRSYWAGWLVLAAVVLLVAVLAGLIGGRRRG